MEESGRNRTPDKLKKHERLALFHACDEALRRTVERFDPNYVIGVGQFAHQRAQSALEGMGVHIGCILHPSPANPRANRGWVECVEEQLGTMGILL